jgi:dienelactone hydrolase
VGGRDVRIASRGLLSGTIQIVGIKFRYEQRWLMAEIVLYHHVQGLTAGVVSFAEELRRAGHTVHTPDLFDARTFATIEDGMAHAREIGFGALLERGVTAAEAVPSPGVVYAGFSFGVMPAQQLAQTRADARGALLFHACLPVSEFGERWPDGVPVQVHGMDADPFFAEEGGDLDAARALVASTDQAELFLYPGEQHLFADSSLPSYDQPAAHLLVERVLRFLHSL